MSDHTPRRLHGLTDEEILDTIIDGFIDGIRVEDLFDRTDATTEEHIRLIRISSALVENIELAQLAVVLRRADRECKTCDQVHQPCPDKAQLN